MEDLSLMRMARAQGLAPAYAGMDPALRRHVIASPRLADIRARHVKFLREIRAVSPAALRHVYFTLPGPDPIRYLTAHYYALAVRDGLAVLWGERVQ